MSDVLHRQTASLTKLVGVVPIDLRDDGDRRSEAEEHISVLVGLRGRRQSRYVKTACTGCTFWLAGRTRIASAATAISGTL